MEARGSYGASAEQGVSNDRGGEEETGSTKEEEEIVGNAPGDENRVDDMAFLWAACARGADYWTRDKV